MPSAILQPGTHPIWFQLTEDGPVYLETIQDAEENAAFIPWPYAVHVRFFYERDNGIIMAVNRDGFIKLVPEERGIALYHFSGGSLWKNYTVGGLFNYEEQDAALLYLDNRFLDTDLPLPDPRTWTFNMESNALFAISVPALEHYPAQDGWDADTLRLSEDGYWYYRVSKKLSPQPEIQILRTPNLVQAGISVFMEEFFNSAPQEVIIDDPSLPDLPEGFVYTGLVRINDSIFACWEEQNGYSIGAAGFMLVKDL